MLILVTGGSGFIGSHVVDKLVDAGHKVRNLDLRTPLRKDVEFSKGSITSMQAVRSAMVGVNVVYHFAAFSNIDLVKAHPVKTVRANVMGTVNVLEAARLSGVKRVLFASSTYVSDERGHLYTTTKVVSEMLCKNYRVLYGLPYTILRLGTSYGPRSREADVVSIFVREALQKRSLVIRGSGNQRRNFVYVEDLATGSVAALSKKAQDKIYTLAGAVSTSILELTKLVRELVGYEVLVKFSPTEREDDYRGEVGDLNKTESDLGWRPKTSLREGVQKYIEWCRAGGTR